MSNTPADQGIRAAKAEVFMSNLIDEFKEFVIVAMADGMDQDFDDHLHFLKAALETFSDFQRDNQEEVV